MKQLTLINLLVIMLCFSLQTLAQQVNILNGDGSPLTATWCFEDTLHPLSGIPAGGSFSGCGIVEQNGAWYFNPARAAAGVSVFVYTCPITYTPPRETGFSRTSRDIRVQAPVLVDAGGDRIVCDQGNFTIPVTTTYGGTYRYSWSPGHFFQDSTRNPARGSMGFNARETFYLVARDANTGCIGYDTITLEDRSITARAEILEAVPDSICTDVPFSLTANHYAGFDYEWRTEDGLIATGRQLTHSYSTEGIHKLMLIVLDSLCPDTSAHDITIFDFVLELHTDQSHVRRLDPVRLYSVSNTTGYHITSWLPGHLFTDQAAYEQHIPADSSRTYVITGSSTYGCLDTASVRVTVTPVLFMPTAFSPNNDGKNDVFRAGSFGDIVRLDRFEIFNRWGKLIWSGYNMDNLKGWDGTVNGSPAESGTYFYFLEGENLQGEKFSMQGDVTLIR